MTVNVLVFDASPLNHFARAGELLALQELVLGFRCVTTRAVREELGRGVPQHPQLQQALDLDWIETVSCDELDVLYAFGRYMNLLGNQERNAGKRRCWLGQRSTRRRRT